MCTGAPMDWSIDDRGNPMTDLGASECTIIDGVEQDYLNTDGFDDLDVAFDTQELVALTGFGCPLDKNEASALPSLSEAPSTTARRFSPLRLAMLALTNSFARAASPDQTRMMPRGRVPPHAPEF